MLIMKINRPITNIHRALLYCLIIYTSRPEKRRIQLTLQIVIKVLILPFTAIFYGTRAILISIVDGAHITVGYMATYYSIRSEDVFCLRFPNNVPVFMR